MHAGTVERDGFRLGIGLGPLIHRDPLTAVPTLQPLAGPAGSCQLAREAVLKVGEASGWGLRLTG
jgi:hypothetical protein